MMGDRLVRQNHLFYDVCLEDRVPPDHLVRRLDAVLDLGWLRAELAPYYSHTGCPSVDPELMIRMMLLGYCYSVRSDRRLCQDVDMSFAYRWFCGLGLEGRVPGSRSTAMAVSATAMSCGKSSIVSCLAAWRRVLCAARASRWMPA